MVMNFARLSSVLLPFTQSTLIWGCCFMNSAALSWYCSVSGPAPAGASQLIDAGPTGLVAPVVLWPGAALPWPQAARSAAGAVIAAADNSILLVVIVRASCF